MVKNIFINLPIKNLKKSMEFFSKLGFSFNLEFTNENTTCMIIGENIFAMLLEEEIFKTFTNKEILDSKKNVEVLLAMQLESKEKVDELVLKAKQAGGIIPREPRDLGFMYDHAFDDLDGHTWEVFYMENKAS